jgi:hypothetical protein
LLDVRGPLLRTPNTVLHEFIQRWSLLLFCVFGFLPLFRPCTPCRAYADLPTVLTIVHCDGTPILSLSSISGLPMQIRRLFFVLRRSAARLRTGFIHYLDMKYMPMVEMVSNEISRKRRSQSAVERLFSRFSRQAFSLCNRIHQQLNN